MEGQKTAKRDRGANFAKGETNILVDIILNHKYIVENKKTDGVSVSEKNAAWAKIAEQFNSESSNFPRSVKTLRGKYDSIKKELRKKYRRIKKAETGVRVADDIDLYEYENKILAAISLMDGAVFEDDDADESLQESNHEIPTLTASPRPVYEVTMDEEFLEEDNTCVEIAQQAVQPKQLRDNNCKRPWSTEKVIDAANVDPLEHKLFSDISQNKTPKPHPQNLQEVQSISAFDDELFSLRKRLIIQQIKLAETERICKEREFKDKAEIAALEKDNLRMSLELKKAQLKKIHHEF